MTENRGRFQPGNKAAYVHGGRSSRTDATNGAKRWDEDAAEGAKTAEEFEAEALQSYPWLATQPVLLRQLVDDQLAIQHYSAMVATHEKYRRTARAEQTRDRKAKAKSALQSTLRQVETVRTDKKAELAGSRTEWIRLGLLQVHAEIGAETAIAKLKELGHPVPGDPGYDAWVAVTKAAVSSR